ERQRSGKDVQRHGVVEVFLQSLLETSSPPRCAGTSAPDPIGDGQNTPSAIDLSAAIKASLGVGIVEILNHAGYLHALVVVQRLLERCPRRSAATEHQIFSDQAAGIREPVWKEVGLRE